MLTALEWALIPAGLLPVLTLLVIRKYRHAASQSLRDRWHLAIVLAALGATTTVIAADALFDWGLGLERWIAFGIVLLGVDLVSGKWLIDYYRGRFR